MARFDIRIANVVGNGIPHVVHYRLNAAETFLCGEPVSVNADGELTEAADDPVDADLLGIAGSDGDTTNAGGLSFLSNRFGQFTDASAIATGDLIPVIVPNELIFWQTSNFSSAGSAFGDVSPAAANVGDEAGLSLISGDWGVDISASNNTVRIVDVLEPLSGLSLQLFTPPAGRTGRIVVFSIVARQLATLGSADAPVA